MPALYINVDRVFDGTFEAAVINGIDRKYILSFKKGEEECLYPLRSDGAAEVFPITMGDGRYTAALYENDHATYYSPVGEPRVFSVKLRDPNAPWLAPSRYVPFDSGIIALAEKLCEGKTTKEEKYNAICGYVKGNFIYDHVKALHTRYDDTTAAPNIGKLLETKMGTCLDLASAVAAMLRSQGIATKLVCGYVGTGAMKTSHAWTVSVVNGIERRYDPTIDAMGASPRKEYRTLRVY